MISYIDIDLVKSSEMTTDYKHSRKNFVTAVSPGLLEPEIVLIVLI